MSHSTSPSAHTRKHERKSVYRTVSWDHRSGESQAGAVCDLTPEGTFLTPFGRGADGIRDGDTVWIALEIEGQRHCLSATVRWRGFSQKHDCEGFGLQFDPETLARAQELYLKIEADGLFFVPT